MKKIKLEGTVFTGKGEGKEFLDLPWVKRQIREKLGFTPQPGTLNLKLTRESVNRKKMLAKLQPMKVCPEEGYCSGLLFKAYVGELECAVLIPEVAGYPEDVLEIIAPSNLRLQLQLKDGHLITVTVCP